jgi:vacuolar protein sorting-associated protein 45
METKINLFALAAEYLNRLIPEDGTMKVLLVDQDTLGVASVAFSQSQLLKKGVFLVDRIENTTHRSVMQNMRCCIFARPAPHIVTAISREVQAGRYSSYTLVFSNAVTTDALDEIARADVKSLVTHVEEFFCDFMVLNNDAFSLPTIPHALSANLISSTNSLRVAEGLAATVVALRRKPTIRFQKNSAYARRIAHELSNILKNDVDLYNYKSKDAVLLILDRSEDPVTPLLMQWTYQSMIHDLIGIDKNRVTLPGTASEEEGFVFSPQDDSFFAANMYNNWGDLCSNVKDYVDHCKKTLNIDRSTATIEEVKQFMQKLPQTKSLTGSVTKHATVVSHLSSVIKERALLDVSLLEQDMVTSSSQGEHWSRLQELARKPSTNQLDVLRLCLIFHIRYEKAGVTSKTEDLLRNGDQRSLLRKLREYYGDRSIDPLFASSGVMASLAKTFSADVGNIYTQHEPTLKKLLHSAYLGKLDAELYPLAPASIGASTSSRAKEVMTFYCGGMTYAEAALVAGVNRGTTFASGSVTIPAAQANELKASIGGTAVLNAQQFLDQLQLLP